MLKLAHSTLTQDLYDVLLKYCKNVRHIQLSRVTFKTDYNWLLQRYEKLERMELGVYTGKRIDEMCTFFERNSEIFELKNNDSKYFKEKSLWDLLY